MQKQMNFPGFAGRSFEDDVRAFNWFTQGEKPIVYKEKQPKQEKTYDEMVGLDPYDRYKDSRTDKINYY